VQGEEEMPMTTSPESMTGLELIRAIADKRVPQAPMAELLDFDLAEVEKGRVVFEGHPSDRMNNPMGTVHGGFAMTMLDSAMGASVHTTLPAGAHYGTLEVKVNLVRPITAATGPLLAEGSVIHGGRTTATAEGRLTGAEDGRLYAHGTTTCMLFGV
jgi:uncharacterized protein (TIGR00369 family)